MLGSDFSLALAKGLGAQAAKNEREGKFRQALEYYDKEVASAASAIREADENAEGRTAEMLLFLGAAHFDSARMEQELQDLGALCFSKAGAGWGIVAGVTDVVLTMLLEKG